MTEHIQLPGEVTKISSLANRSLRVVFDTQEAMDDEAMGKTMSLLGKFGWWVFVPNGKVEEEAVANLPPVVTEEGERTPSMRLRAVIWRYWELKGKQGGFNTFYADQVEKLITAYKEKLV